jgi:hypothetical protein
MDLAAEADGIRRSLHPNDIVTYIVDRNINYTNVCWVACSFCAFYRTKRQAQNGDGYVLSVEQVLQKIQETVDLGGPVSSCRAGCTRTSGWSIRPTCSAPFARSSRGTGPRALPGGDLAPRRQERLSWKRPSRSSKRPG